MGTDGVAGLSGSPPALITADAGGSNGYRPRLWKVVLQGLANDLGLRISVCHFPPGTSKWNRSSIACFASSRRTGVASRRSGRISATGVGGSGTGCGSKRSRTTLYRTGIRISEEQCSNCKAKFREDVLTQPGRPQQSVQCGHSPRRRSRRGRRQNQAGKTLLGKQAADIAGGARNPVSVHLFGQE